MEGSVHIGLSGHLEKGQRLVGPVLRLLLSEGTFLEAASGA